MLARVGLAVTCSAVAFTVTQLFGKRDEVSAEKKGADAEREKEPRAYDSAADDDDDAAATPKEEEEEVKRVNTPVSPAASIASLGSLTSFSSEQNADQLLLPDFPDLLALDVGVNAGSYGKSRDGKKYRRVAGPLTRQAADRQLSDDEGPVIDVPDEFLLEEDEGRRRSSDSLDFDFKEHVDLLASESEELGRLRSIVSELREREEGLQGVLLEYYGLKEREDDFVLMEQDLKRKADEIQGLTTKVSRLEARELKRKSEESKAETLENDLKEARAKIGELQKQSHGESGQTKAEIIMLKQKLKELQHKEREWSDKQSKESTKDAKKEIEIEKKLQLCKELEVEVVELRRTNKDLQYQKRELVVKLGVAEGQTSQLAKVTEAELVSRAEADSSALRHANEDLYKQVEGLQSSRFSEVEELVYLRWVNACLRYELRNQKPKEEGKPSALDLSKDLSPRSQAKAKQLMLEYAGPEVKGKGGEDDGYDSSASEASVSSEMSDMLEPGAENSSGSGRGSSGRRHSGLIRTLKKWGSKKADSESLDGGSPGSSGRSSPAHRSSGGHLHRGPLESIMVRNAGDGAHEITSFGARSDEGGNSPISKTRLRAVRARSDFSGVAASFSVMSKTAGPIDEKYPAFKDRHKAAVHREKVLKKKVEEKVEERQAAKRSELEAAKPMTIAEIQKRELRVPKPPPKPSAAGPGTPSPKTPGAVRSGVPLPPLPPGVPMPPPPPPPGSKLPPSAGGKDKMQRAPEVVEFYQSLMKRDAKREMAGGMNSADARNNIVGELENRSAHLLAIKADVETQGDFVKSLAGEVRGASYSEIEDVVSFVLWLDDELSFLVDERAVLKHFDWPESKTDALREAAFEYQDLKNLCHDISSYRDDTRIPYDSSLKKMLAALEKVEGSVYALLRTRDMAVARYKEYNIPTQWLSDRGLVGKIKRATVGLANQYMRRVAFELDSLEDVAGREPVKEFLLLQGVRFAFRVHQFAGGFDPDTMTAFEELRNRAHKKESLGVAAAADE